MSMAPRLPDLFCLACTRGAALRHHVSPPPPLAPLARCGATNGGRVHRATYDRRGVRDGRRCWRELTMNWVVSKVVVRAIFTGLHLRLESLNARVVGWCTRGGAGLCQHAAAQRSIKYFCMRSSPRCALVWHVVTGQHEPAPSGGHAARDMLSQLRLRHRSETTRSSDVSH